jgi:hypothetical protein
MRYTSTKRNYGSRNQLQRQVNCIVFNISFGQNVKQPTNDSTTNEDTVKYPNAIIVINFKFKKCELIFYPLFGLVIKLRLEQMKERK